MSTYIIDFTDPLKPGFTIAPGGFNGPGGAQSDTTLRLYGRGALEWGESVDENLARLAENFAGASFPLNATFGQLWLKQELYVQNTAIVLTPAVNAPVNAFHRYRFEDDAWYTSGEAPYPFEVFVTAVAIGTYGAGTTLGEYVFSVADDVLYRWDSPYAQAAPQWMPRSRTSGTSNPVDGTTKPKQSLLMWQPAATVDGGEWSGPAVTTVAAVAPSEPSTGMLWWDSVNGQLNVWDGAAWQAVLISGVPAGGDIDMNNFNITNLAAQVYPDLINLTHAATVGYVNDAVSLVNLTATLDGTYINTGGDTMTGVLNLVANGAYPQASTNQAATQTYVNQAIAAVGSPGSGGFSSVHSGGGAVSHKPGDIYINAGTAHIWIATTTASSAPTFYASSGSDANWKQVFPAQYA